MKFISKSQAQIHKNSDSCIATEYPIGDPDIDFATVEITGRYPDEGRVMNRTSKEIFLILKGTGKIVIEGREVKLNQDDVILVEPGDKYFWEGTMSIAVSCTPPWSKEQHQKVA
jgi:mannose-6-phosphate isomerase-like protein (cupin superfamily)